MSDSEHPNLAPREESTSDEAGPASAADSANDELSHAAATSDEAGPASAADSANDELSPAVAAASEGAPHEPLEATHRRAPRYGRFILTGILCAGVIAFVTTLITQRQSDITPTNLYWVLMLYLVPIGVLVGATLALVLDRLSMKRADSQLDR